MVNAKYFVEDFGGFSKLISDVNFLTKKIIIY